MDAIAPSNSYAKVNTVFSLCVMAMVPFAAIDCIWPCNIEVQDGVVELAAFLGGSLLVFLLQGGQRAPCLAVARGAAVRVNFSDCLPPIRGFNM